MDLGLSRRAALGGFAILGAGCTAESLSIPGFSRAVAETLPDMSTPEANLHHIMRMSASVDGKDAPWRFTGTIYGIVGEEQPRPMFKFEGMEIYRITPLGNGSFEMTGNTATFFRDVETGEYIYELDNPYTGKRIDVPASVQGGGAGRGYTYAVDGIRPTFLKDQMPDVPPSFEWEAVEGTVWVHSSRVYPPGMTSPRAERQTAFAPLKEVLDPNAKRYSAKFGSTFFAPWMAWMEMGDQPGHMIWHAGGVKLSSIDQLSPRYRERIERDHPERLTGLPDAGSGGKEVE